MNTNKLAYFIVLGVLAFGLTSDYQKGHYPALHRALGAAESSLCRIVAHAEQTLAIAQIVTDPPVQEFRVDDRFIAGQQAQVERAAAEHQADLDRVLAGHEVDLDRAMALRQAHWHGLLGCTARRYF